MTSFLHALLESPSSLFIISPLILHMFPSIIARSSIHSRPSFISIKRIIESASLNVDTYGQKINLIWFVQSPSLKPATSSSFRYFNFDIMMRNK